MLEFLTVDYLWEPCLAIFGLFSSGISAAASMANTQAQIASNERMQRAAQNYNTSERLATQRYGTSEREAAQAYNTSEREAQNQWSINAYNDYQSPAAMARQYAEAGLNPGLAAGNSGSLGTASGSSAQSSGATSSFQGVTPPYQNVEGFASGFQNIAHALKAIAEAKKTGVETSQIEQLFGENLKHVRLSNVSLELANSMDAVRLSHLNDKERLAVQQALKTLSLTDVDAEKKRHEIDLIIEQGLIAKNEREHWYERFAAQQSNIEADTNLKGAQAGEASASAAVKWDEHSMRDLKAELLRQTSNNHYSQSRLNYASERVAEITGDMNELLRDAQEFTGERSKANPSWRRLSAYGRSLIESWVSNAQILGLKGLGDAHNLSENPFNADGHIGSAYKVALNLQSILNGHDEETYNESKDIYNKFD